MNTKPNAPYRLLAHQLLDLYFDRAEAEQLHGHISLEIHCHSGVATSIKEKYERLHKTPPTKEPK